MIFSADKYRLRPVYIAGPTASGKSELAFRLAKLTGGRIISADSMQIYRGLDIGTAKESAERRREVEHRMIDIIDADREFSVAEYAEAASREISECLSEGILPIVAGGTGLYFEALIYPMRFASANKDDALRKALAAECAERGAQYMHDKLRILDPESADRLHINDIKRVIRALEIVMTTGKPLSESGDDMDIDTSDIIMAGLNTDRSVLYERIDRRVDEMFAHGLIDEVYSIGNFGYQSMQAIGYKEFAAFSPVMTNGKNSLSAEDESAVRQLIKQHTRNYAKRQLTWFRRYPYMRWFECGDYHAAISYIADRLNS